MTEGNGEGLAWESSDIIQTSSEIQKDDRSYCPDLGSDRELLKPASSSSALLSFRDGSNISLCFKKLLTFPSHRLGLSKGGGKEENTPTASTPFP